MNASLSGSAAKVQQALAAAGLTIIVRELPDSTRTAAEAAAAIGCDVGQIVKSLVFVADGDGTGVLVLASGRNRVDETTAAAIVGRAIRKASADEVRRLTDFAIGGVPPLGHPERLRTIVDRDLLDYAEVWAAAGTPHAVFPIAPVDLVRVTEGLVARIARI